MAIVQASVLVWFVTRSAKHHQTYSGKTVSFNRHVFLFYC